MLVGELLQLFCVQVMGIPKDAYKVKFQAGATDEAGNYTSWENATLTTSVTITTYAVVKFSIFQDKSSGKNLIYKCMATQQSFEYRSSSSFTHCAPGNPVLWISACVL